ENARDDLFVRPDVGHDGFHVVGREPVDDRAVTFTTREAQHALAQRGDEDRWLLGNRNAEAKPAHAKRLVFLIDLLTGQRRAQKANGVAYALIRLVERHTVPSFDDDIG